MLRIIDDLLDVSRIARGKVRLTLEILDARMIVQNADGSRPEMCGNGLRCVALKLAERDALEHAEYAIETDAGLRRCEVSRAGSEASVLIEMGRAGPRG